MSYVHYKGFNSSLFITSELTEFDLISLHLQGSTAATEHDVRGVAGPRRAARHGGKCSADGWPGRCQLFDLQSFSRNRNIIKGGTVKHHNNITKSGKIYQYIMTYHDITASSRPRKV